MSGCPFYADPDVTLHMGDALEVVSALPSASVDCVLTSPPYWGLRDYGVTGQWGHEPTVAGYVEHLVALFAELRRVLVPTGVAWLNLGDTYAGKANAGATIGHRDRAEHKVAQRNRTADAPYKSLEGVPWRVALALIDDRWVLRNDVIWHKPNAMPHPVTDRLKVAHEHLFLLTPGANSHFDLDPIREPLTYPEFADGSRTFGGRNALPARGDDGTASSRMGGTYGTAPGRVHAPPLNGNLVAGEEGRRTATAGRKYGQRDAEVGHRPADGARHLGGDQRGRNPGDVWTLSTEPSTLAHFALMPQSLARRAILAGCPPGGTVLDPFAGACTTGVVARALGRRFVGVELKREHLALAVPRFAQQVVA